jgi:hypothetical protein
MARSWWGDPTVEHDQRLPLIEGMGVPSSEQSPARDKACAFTQTDFLLARERAEHFRAPAVLSSQADRVELTSFQTFAPIVPSPE